MKEDPKNVSKDIGATSDDVNPVRIPLPYMQNRELSWLVFNERVLDQGADPTVPLLERLKFAAIFSSNLQEFFMVRVGSLTDLSLIKKPLYDNKTLMTPQEQLDAIYRRCSDIYPNYEVILEDIRKDLEAKGIMRLCPEQLNPEQKAHLDAYAKNNILPFLSPQIVNVRHPFPHLENGALYLVVRLGDKPTKKDDGKQNGSGSKNVGAKGVMLGIIPQPHQSERLIPLPGNGFQFILLEHVLEYLVEDIFSMYTVKETNIVCVTRNADLDASEGIDEVDEDYREYMKRILKKRTRLTPVRVESARPLSQTTTRFLFKRLDLKAHQAYVTSVPLDMSYVYDLVERIGENQRKQLTYTPFLPQWTSSLNENQSIIKQVEEKDVLLFYPYESMDPFIQLLKEASADPAVISIKITLYRLASRSNIAEALIAAAENGKEVTALLELRARFDESNNIEWSQRFEEAGIHVIYGFQNYKVHSKICAITRQTDRGLQHITQLGTGNYNEKTAQLYTDLAFITTDRTIGRDAVEFFRNVNLENISDNYDLLWVAPLQIKASIISRITQQIERAEQGKPCGLFFKTNSITDKDIIEKIVQASQAGVPTTLFVRGISCIVPGISEFTENVHVVSIVGRLLEHSRIYGFGPRENMSVYLSSADLMTRNMDKRVEIAWPVLNSDLKEEILHYIDMSLQDTAKLRELLPDKSYTPLGYFAETDENGKKKLFDSQEHFIKQAQESRLYAATEAAERRVNQPEEVPPSHQKEGFGAFLSRLFKK